MPLKGVRKQDYSGLQMSYKSMSLEGVRISLSLNKKERELGFSLRRQGER